MEFTKRQLAYITQTYPGDYALYRIDNGKMKTLYFSKNLPQLSGMSKEEYETIIYQNAINIVFENDRSLIENRLAEFIQNQKENTDINLAYRIIHKKNNFVWVRAIARIIGYEESIPILLVIFQSSLFGTQEHCILLNHANTNIYVVDPVNYELLYANEVALKNMGNSDYAGKKCYQYFSGFNAPCPWCSIDDMKDGYVEKDEFYFAITKRWLHIDCHAIEWFGRKAIAVYGIDITEQKNRQHSLEIDKNSLQNAVDHLPVGIAVCEIRDSKITTVAVNPLIYELMGVTKENFASSDNDLLFCVHPDDRVNILLKMKQCNIPNQYIKLEYRFTKDQGKTYHYYRFEARTISQENCVMAFICILDITAEKLVEFERKRIRQMYEAAVENANLVVWEYNINQKRITMADNEFTQYDYRLFGLNKIIDNVPDSLLPYIAEEDIENFLKMYDDIAQGKATASCEVWYKMKPGQAPRCQRIYYTTLYDDNGKPISAYGIGQNITSMKLEQEKYKQAYEELSGSYSHTLASFQLNLTTNWCGNGKSALPFVLKQQASGTVDGYFKEFSKLIADEDIKKDFFKSFNRKKLIMDFKRGKRHIALEYPILYPDGQLFWREGDLYMIQNPVTGDVEAITYAIDITKRKENENILRCLTEDSCEFIGLIEPVKRTFEIRYGLWKNNEIGINQKIEYEKSVELMAQEFTVESEKQHFLDHVSFDELEKAIAKRGQYIFSYNSKGKKGENTKKQLCIQKLDDKSKTILMIQYDVTDAYQNEQKRLKELQTALEEAQKANSAKTEFVSRISHDIRTPIGISINMTDFALQDIHNPKKLRQDLEKIKSSNAFLLSLINDVLDISKIDSGNIELHPEPYPFEEYISNIQNIIRPLCEQKGIKFTIYRRQITGIILADKTRLNQIALNLLTNAVKYTPVGGEVTYISDSKSLPNHKIKHVMEIRDTGIGMSKEFQEKMFEPFTQEQDNILRTNTEMGTGLGLSIVRRIADLMGSKISVHSEPGKGTIIRCVTIFPALDIVLEKSDLVKEKEEEGKKVLTGKILLAEDNKINAEIAVRILKSFGLKIIVTENGEDAFDTFCRSLPYEFNAILTDIQMPIMDGYEMTERIRSLNRIDAQTIPIIAMTANAFTESIEHSLKSGMNSHITKPINPDSLYETLKRFIQDIK